MISGCASAGCSNYLAGQAPAKIIVVGEYLVLEGIPAVVMSFDRYAKVSITASDSDCYQFSSAFWANTSDINAPPALQLTLQGDHLRWLPDASRQDPRYRLVQEVMQALHHGGWLDSSTQPVAVTIDSSDFFMQTAVGQQKLGLGSSAALTVALATTLAQWAGAAPLADRQQWFSQLLSMHRQFQQGVGSGIDLAASLYGGSLIYQLDRSLAASVTPLAWPANLASLCIWSGSPAATVSFVERYQAWRQLTKPATQALVAQLRELAMTCAQALITQATSTFLQCIDTYAAGLKKLSAASGVDIFSAQHQHIQALARAHGVAYKPCGAGGGDIGLAFSDDPERLAVLSASLQQAGFVLVPGQPSEHGFTSVLGEES